MLHNQTTSDDCRTLLDATAVVSALASSTERWHTEREPAAPAEDLLLQLHLANYTLWHLEDEARDPHASDAVVAGLKRRIDTTNQRRNDLVEQFDAQLLQALAGEDLPRTTAPLHSETPGLIADRLSILALKIYHTAEEVERPGTAPGHRERNRQRLLVLQQQNTDLGGCLAALWQQVCEGTRSYRQYRQMKMYNDPELNPVLYTAQAARNPGDA